MPATVSEGTSYMTAPRSKREKRGVRSWFEQSRKVVRVSWASNNMVLR